MIEKQKQKRGPRVGRLHTVGAVASELGKIYRLARVGTIKPVDLPRYVAALTAMRQCHEGQMLEVRLTAIEARVAASEARDAEPPWAKFRQPPRIEHEH